MTQIRILLLELLLSVCSIPIFCQPFPCDGNLLFSTNSGSGFTLINKVAFLPFNNVTYDQNRRYQGGNFNALGFNSKDNYIYAVQENSNEIVRIKADNSFEIVGKVPNLDQLTTTAGDCTPTGHYLCHDQVLDRILVFDVVDNFALINQIDLFWDPLSLNSGSFTARIDDFAIDPTNPTVAYSFQGSYFDADLEPEETKGYLLKINLDFQSSELGMVTPITAIQTDEIRKIGSLIFSSDGTLFAYGAMSPNPDPIQNQLLSIDKLSGVVNIFRSTGPGGIGTDGCSCPYNLSFTNFVDPNFALCSNSELNYMLSVNNRTFQDIPNASIIDTLTEGMIISNISGNFNGNIAAGTGIGTRVLQIDNLEVLAREETIINIEVEVIDLPIKLVENQALLLNLPDKFGYDLPSDDPATPGFIGDSTTIFSDPNRLEAFTIDITHPTNCLQPEDGRLVIFAPVLVPDVTYEVNMLNEDFEEFSSQVIIDERNTFVIDSLFPGEYTLYKITPQNSRCSFAMKDTTITVIAPNDLIQADAFTNSPICDGATLELSAIVFPPEGSITWTGPNRFESTELAITLDTAFFEQSGVYEMVFSYGVCEQVRALDVLITPSIEANINSQDGYCERDTMRLIAEGAGDLQSFSWIDPNGISFSDQLIEIPFVDVEQEGNYYLIIDNGFCKDTTSKYIRILPAPELTLPDAVKSNFCDPLELRPAVITDAALAYTWTPSEGLSCVDCPNPTIAEPINYWYQLNVHNEFSCQDSATVFVFLDQENLIYTPNVFSPNNDGVNDFFQIFPNCGVASINQFQIFDRNGSLVYDLGSVQAPTDHSILWDGSVNNRQVNIGVYIWQMELTLIDGTKSNLTGSITLFR